MRDLTKGNESKLILSFATPMLLGNIFQQLAQLVNAAIVGKYIGADAMASVGSSFYIIFALVAMVMGIGIGGTVVVSQYFGAGMYDKVKRASDTILIFFTLSGLVLGLVGIVFCEPLLRLTSLPERLMEDAVTYLSINFAGLFAMFGYNAVSATLRGIGDSVRPLYFLIISTGLNLLLDLLFVIVFGWGVKGVAYATLISVSISYTLAVLYLNKNHTILKYSLKGLIFDRVIFKQALKIGLPSGIQQTLVALSNIALITMVNKMGPEVITAFSAAGRIDAFISMPAMNFSAALSAFVGQNLALKYYSRIRKGLYSTLFLSGIICIICTLIVVFWGDNIMQLFVKKSEPGYDLIISTGHQYLVIVCSFYIVFSSMFVINGLLRGAGATLVPMFITLTSLWLVRIPLAHFLSEKMGAQGIWWAIPMAWCLGFAGSMVYYLSGKWKNKGIVNTTDSV